MHLQLQPTASGEVSVAVDRSRLDPEARAAYGRLAQRLGATALARVLGVLIAGNGPEAGLHALADFWRGLRPGEPLSGRTLVDLGRVLSNSGTFGTLDDLAALTEFRAGRYRGLFPLTEDPETARSWIGVHGTAPYDFGLDALLDDLPSGPPAIEDLIRSPWMLQHLRHLQTAYDEAVRRAANRAPTPADPRP